MGRIVLMGMKGCGKTTIGQLLAAELRVPFLDCDAELEKAHQQARGEIVPFRQIFAAYGEAYFQALEMSVLKNIARTFKGTDFVFACGGGTPLRAESREIVTSLGRVIFLNVEKGVLLKRILAQGIPAFFPYQDDPQRSLDVLLEARLPVYQQCADLTLDIAEEAPETVVAAILQTVRSL